MLPPSANHIDKSTAVACIGEKSTTGTGDLPKMKLTVIAMTARMPHSARIAIDSSAISSFFSSDMLQRLQILLTVYGGYEDAVSNSAAFSVDSNQIDWCHLNIALVRGSHH